MTRSSTGCIRMPFIFRHSISVCPIHFSTTVTSPVSLSIVFCLSADIRQQADACLAEFLREITEVVAVDFGPMVVILVEQCQGADKPGIWYARHE